LNNSINIELINFTLNNLKSQKSSVFRPIAQKYGVDHAILICCFKGLLLLPATYYEIRQLLLNSQERLLINWINKLSNHEILSLNTIIYNIAAEICRKQSERICIYKFINQYSNKLVLVILDSFNLSCKNTDNYISIKQYFNMI
jgi:hypothetical protein